MNALETLLAGLPLSGEAGGAAELLARLAVTSGPQRVSLRLSVGNGLIRVRVSAAKPSRPFAESEPGAYVRDLMALHDMATRWGHSYWSATGRSSWWAQLGDVGRDGGAR